MQILGSKEHANLKTQKTDWLQLSIINPIDFVTNPISYEKVGNGRIYYSLKRCTPLSQKMFRVTNVRKLTSEMKEVLIKKGHIII
jgi:hypothetical protein